MQGGKEVFEAMVDFDRVLGLRLAELAKPASTEVSDEIQAMLQQREIARKSRDFATSDRIRDELWPRVTS